MKNMSKNSNRINKTDFLINNNTIKFKLDFSVNVFNFNLQNLNKLIFFNSVLYFLLPSTFWNILNHVSAFDLILLTQFININKKSKKNLEFKVQKFLYEYLLFLINCSIICY